LTSRATLYWRRLGICSGSGCYINGGSLRDISKGGGKNGGLAERDETVYLLRNCWNVNPGSYSYALERRLIMLDIRYKTGSEGPAHDPYGYEEWTIWSDNPNFVDPECTLKIHRGLSEWFQLSSLVYEGFKFQKLHGKEELWESTLEKFITQSFGYTFKQIERIYNRMQRPFCKECKVYPKGRDLEIFPGYPGEEVLVHRGCGNPIGCMQNMSYII